MKQDVYEKEATAAPNRARASGKPGSNKPEMDKEEMKKKMEAAGTPGPAHQALNAFVGGRFFPGTHHRARFDVRETADEVAVALRSEDGETRIAVRGRRATQMPRTSVFPDVAAASAFFESRR